MGLDITAYSKVELIDTAPSYEAFETKYGWDDDRRRYVDAQQDFQDRMAPLIGGLYKIHGERLDFRAGSYSGYGDWRDDLARLALGVDARTVWQDRQRYAGTAFYELIDFSDCEGIIGTDAARKLAADFDRFQAKADQHESTYFREKYRLWCTAMHLAADGGFVGFH